MDKEKKSGNIFKRRIGRRAFLKTSLASGVGGLVAPNFFDPDLLSIRRHTIQKHGEYVVEHTRKIPIVRDVDVLVVGGGMAVSEPLWQPEEWATVHFSWSILDACGKWNIRNGQ